MIQIESYLRDPCGTFVPVEEVMFTPADPIHIDGAIHLTINHVDIIDLSMWDLVDQLWAYIADVVVRFKETDEASCYFPDQPIELKFQRDNQGRVVVSVDPGGKTRRVVVEADELLEALRKAGLKFFHEMGRIVPANAAVDQIYVDKLLQLQVGGSR